MTASNKDLARHIERALTAEFERAVEAEGALPDPESYMTWAGYDEAGLDAVPAYEGQAVANARTFLSIAEKETRILDDPPMPWWHLTTDQVEYVRFLELFGLHALNEAALPWSDLTDLSADFSAMPGRSSNVALARALPYRLVLANARLQDAWMHAMRVLQEEVALARKLRDQGANDGIDTSAKTE